MLERGGASSAGDVIILITTGSSSADQVQSALALASRKQVRVSVVAFAYVPTPGTHRAGALRNLQSLAEATGGRMTAVASKGVGTMSHISMLIELGDALLTTLDFHQGSDNVPTLVSFSFVFLFSFSLLFFFFSFLKFFFISFSYLFGKFTITDWPSTPSTDCPSDNNARQHILVGDNRAH
jgi:hypothetical protein